MSRIGRQPIVLPAGVTVTVGEDNLVTVKGKLGQLSEKIRPSITVKVEGNEVIVSRVNDEKENRALHGLSRTLIYNMVVGVTEGYSKKLEIIGVGYRAQKQGNKLVLNLGYSHPVEFEEPQGITFDVPTPNKVVVSGINKQQVGQMAADIRIKRAPEPYKGKGIRYEGEYVRRKEGKTGK